MNIIRRLSNERIIDLTGGFTGIESEKDKEIEREETNTSNYRKQALQRNVTPIKRTSTPAKPISASSSLPLYSYTRPPCFSSKGLKAPALAYTRSVEEANDLISLLNGHVGFDMEWKVDFRKNAKQRRTAIVQICDDKLIIIVHLHHMSSLPHELVTLLTDKERYKFGVNIGNDGRKFFNDYKVQLHGLLELTYLAKSVHSEDLGSDRRLISLDRLAEYLLKHRLDKGNERVGNWEAVLDWKQIEYAANDVYAGYQMYARLIEQQEQAKHAEKTHDSQHDHSAFLVDKDYAASAALKEIPNGAKASAIAKASQAPQSPTSTADTPQTPDTTAKSISERVVYDRTHKSILREEKHLRALQPRHHRAMKTYYEEGKTLDQTRRQLRPEKPLAKITVLSYISEALLLSKEGYSDAMLSKIQNDIRYCDEKTRKTWYEDYGCFLE